MSANPVSIVPMKDGGFLLNFADNADVLQVDDRLTEKWHKNMQTHTAGYSGCRLSINKQETKIALSGRNDLQLLTITGTKLHDIAHEAWPHFQGSNCVFTEDDQYLLFVLPAASAGNDDQVHLLRLSDYTIVAAATIPESFQTYRYTLIATPENDIFFLEAAAGQDGVLLYQVKIDGGKLELKALPQCSDKVFGSFSPEGKKFVMAPHYDGDLCVFSFPEMTQIIAVSEALVLESPSDYTTAEDEDSLNFIVFFLNELYLLVFTRFGRLLVIDSNTLRASGELLPENTEIMAYDSAGRPTENLKDIVDFGGDIIELLLTPGKQLMLTHNSGQLRLYELPEAFR